jgi:hypothetical protein
MENLLILNPCDPKSTIKTLVGLIKSNDDITLLDCQIFDNEVSLRNSGIEQTQEQKGTLLYDYHSKRFVYKPCFVTKLEILENPYRFITYFTY